MKRILITGKDSYIGTNFEKWLGNYQGEYQVDTIDMVDESWRGKDFSGYDVVFHVAGIAHVSSDQKKRDLYYKVNRDLAIDVAKNAKDNGVRQFIFMSSIIIYGNQTEVITRSVKPEPVDFYGDSKLQAEEGIRTLEDETFNIVIVRPPMIYGKNSKGNYSKLAKLAKTTPIFPYVDNKRSMLHIDNLCEFIKLMVDNEEKGIFFPQNKAYVNTSKLVKEIGKTHGKRVWLVKGLNGMFCYMARKIGFINKIFGSLMYDIEMSEYKADYRVRDFEGTIAITER